MTIASRTLPSASQFLSSMILPAKLRTASIVGGAIAAGVLVNALIARRTERRHPPTGQFIEMRGVRLHYIDRGSGTPIVLLHGNGAMADDFQISGLIETFSRDHRVIAFDRPGFGYSERPRGTVWTASAQAALLAAALHKLGVRRPVLVAHSWGTLVALSMALEHKVAARALVLLSGYYFPGPRLDALQASLAAVPILGDLLSHTISPLLSLLATPLALRKLFGPAPVDARFKRRFPAAMARRPGQLRAAAAETALMVPGAASLVRRYKDLHMPVIIVAGSGDRLVDTTQQSGRLHAELPHSEFRRIRGAGHMIEHTAAEQVSKAVRQALRAA